MKGGDEFLWAFLLRSFLSRFFMVLGWWGAVGDMYRLRGGGDILKRIHNGKTKYMKREGGASS